MKFGCKSLTPSLILRNVRKASVFSKRVAGLDKAAQPSEGIGGRIIAFLSQVRPSRDKSAPNLQPPAHPWANILLISQAWFISFTKSINHPILAIKKIKRLN